MKRKVLFFANYYYPDKSAMARLMTDLSQGISDEFDINVVCAIPSYAGRIAPEYQKKRFYKEKIGNVNVIRVRVSENDKSKKIKRVHHVLSYFFNAIIATIRIGKCDIVYATTAPPILGGVLGRIAKRISKAKYVYVIQDFNPEQIEAVSFSKNKFVISVMRHLDYNSCKSADSLVIIGRDMQETLNRRFSQCHIEGKYIHNWVDEQGMYPVNSNDYGVYKFKEKYNLNNKFVFMYLGNLGLYYDLMGLLKVIKKFKKYNDIVFAFVGTGAVEDKMKNYCKENDLKNVRFIPYQTGDDLIFAMNSADIHIVTNAKGIKGVSVPSKIYGIMAVNKPVIGILESGSEVWKIIDESGIGVLCETGDYNQIESKIRYICENKRQIVKMGANGRNILLSEFSKHDAIEKYKQLFNSLCKKED